MLNFVCIKSSPLLLVILLFTSIASKTVFALDLSPDQYTDLKSIAQQVTMGCPAPDCTIVALGRSPSPVVEFIRAAFPGIYQIVDLPLSSFRYNIHAPSSDRFVNRGDRSLADIEIAKLNLHLEKFLPQAPKKILVLDFTSTGRPVFAASQYIENFYLGRQHNVELLPTAIINPSDTMIEQQLPGNIQKYKMNKFSVIAAHELGSLFDLAAFDDLAKYGEYNFMGDAEPELNSSTKRTEFLVYLSEQIAQDETIAREKPPKLNTKRLGSCLKKQL